MRDLKTHLSAWLGRVQVGEVVERADLIQVAREALVHISRREHEKGTLRRNAI